MIVLLLSDHVKKLWKAVVLYSLENSFSNGLINFKVAIIDLKQSDVCIISDVKHNYCFHGDTYNLFLLIIWVVIRAQH